MKGRNQALSTYTLTEQDEFLCLVDLNQGCSVMNDAEDVIADLVAAGHDLTRKRVIYQDTMGYWDEIVVRDGRFSDYRPIRETELSRAMTKARR